MRSPARFAVADVLASEVSKVRFWMGHFGAKTPKRHYMYANSVKVNLLNKGKLSFGLFKHNQKTAKYHVDAHGIRRFTGTVHLRETERLLLHSCFALSLPLYLFFSLSLSLLSLYIETEPYIDKYVNPTCRCIYI